ncbi:MAG: pilus assembly protein [Hyphomonadaceae bacterium]|nr:pilus assembly protein [Hyphomonadaceae bacterium]
MSKQTGKRRFIGNRGGATAVEFALVAPVMLFMVVAVVEYSLFYFKTSFLKHVLYEASRNVQTGEVQDAGDPQAYFQTEYCDDAIFLIRCEDVFFDVRSASTLSAVSFPTATFNSQGEPTNFVFQPGTASQVTTMRVATPYRFVTPFMQDVFQPEGSPAIIVGYSVARNEPF